MMVLLRLLFLPCLVYTSAAGPWIRIEGDSLLQFASPQLEKLFHGTRSAAHPPAASNVAFENFLAKSPVCEVVVQRFHFTSNTPLVLSLRDQFCAGQNYTVLDNGVYLAENYPDLPTICGVSTASRNQVLIYSPQFMTAEFALPAGEHKLLIIVKGSRIGGHVSSMQIVLYPTGPVDSAVTIGPPPPSPPLPPPCNSPICQQDFPSSGSLIPICRINKMSKESRLVGPDFQVSSILPGLISN